MATLAYAGRHSHCRPGNPSGRETALSGKTDDHSSRGQKSEKGREIGRCSAAGFEDGERGEEAGGAFILKARQGIGFHPRAPQKELR